MGNAQLLCFYDADCGICGAAVRLGERWDRHGRIEFVPNFEQARLPAGVSPDLVEETIVVVAEDGRTHLRARAVAALLVALPLGWPLSLLLRLPLLSWLADRVYRLVARNRRAISSRLGLGVCRVDPR